VIIPLMAGYPSNLAKKFSPTEQFPQHILPLLPLYNSQWWGYESLTAIVLVEVCQGTKQWQRHGDTCITIIFFTVVNNLYKQWNIG